MIRHRMSRPAILAAAVALFCVSFPRPAEGQRTVPRNSIIKKPSEPAVPPRIAAAMDSARPVLAPGTGSIRGAAIDSLHDQLLAGAGVSVMGLASRHAVTAANGTFRIDSIPPGRYVLELTHPVLDSLGVRVLSDSITVTDGQIQAVELAIPSIHTVMMAVCSPAKLRFGPGVILGRVVDADTQKPSVGAEVSVAWMETEVSTAVGLRTSPRVRKAIVGADGTYRICGVPPDFTGTLQAIHGAAKTAEVPLDVVGQSLTMRMLYLPPVGVAAGDTGAAAVRVARAVIVGHVTNAGGVPVSGARVSVQGSASSVATGTDGKFTLTGVMPGTQSILVRRVGYSPVETPLDVTSMRTNELTVRMGSYTPLLSSVDVKAKSDPIESTGFERRRKMGMGKYMDLATIQKGQPTYTSDILRRIPGLYVTGSGPSATVSTTRSQGCVAFLVDNNPVAANAGQSIDQIIGVQDIVAVEFYQPIDVPMELSTGSNSGCALLVLWTKGKLDQRSKK